MGLVDSETELTTAATDLLLGAVCVGLAAWLWSAAPVDPWKQGVWVGAFLLMGGGAGLGAVAHGLRLTATMRAVLWWLIYLSLGLAVSLIAVAAAADGWGEAAGRTAVPWALAVGVGLTCAVQWLSGAFFVFAVYQVVVTVVVLGVYASLAGRALVDGTSSIVVGLVLSLVAAAVQMSRLRLHVVVKLDHNGLFHLVQTLAVGFIGIGARAGLTLGR